MAAQQTGFFKRPEQDREIHILLDYDWERNDVTTSSYCHVMKSKFGSWSCDCKAFRVTKRPCAHIHILSSGYVETRIAFKLDKPITCKSLYITSN